MGGVKYGVILTVSPRAQEFEFRVAWLFKELKGLVGMGSDNDMVRLNGTVRGLEYNGAVLSLNRLDRTVFKNPVRGI